MLELIGAAYSWPFHVAVFSGPGSTPLETAALSAPVQGRIHFAVANSAVQSTSIARMSIDGVARGEAAHERHALLVRGVGEEVDLDRVRAVRVGAARGGGLRERAGRLGEDVPVQGHRALPGRGSARGERQHAVNAMPNMTPNWRMYLTVSSLSLTWIAGPAATRDTLIPPRSIALNRGFVDGRHREQYVQSNGRSNARMSTLVLVPSSVEIAPDHQCCDRPGAGALQRRRRALRVGPHRPRVIDQQHRLAVQRRSMARTASG